MTSSLLPLRTFLFLILLLGVTTMPGQSQQAARPELALQIGHSETVSSIAFSPDGRLVVSGSSDKTIKVWEVATGRLLRTLRGHSSYVSSVAFSPDGQRIVSGSWDSAIRVWDAASGKLLRTLSGYQGDVESVPLPSDGHNGGVSSVTFSSDGKQLVSGSSDETIKVWDVATGKVLRTLSGHGRYVNSVAFSSDGNLLVSASGDKMVKLWDVATGKLLRTLSGHRDFVRSVAFSPDGKLLVSGSEDQRLKVWDVATGELLRTLRGHSGGVHSVKFSPDGNLVISGSYDNTLKAWDVTAGRLLRTLRGHSDAVLSVTFSPDGKQLTSGRYDNALKVWDSATGRQLRTLKGRGNMLSFGVFSPDGKRVVINSHQHKLEVWDIATGRLLRTFNGASVMARSVAFSPDGKQLVSGSRDKTVKLWDVATGRLLRTLRGHGEDLRLAAFSANGKRLVSGTKRGEVKVWDVATGKLLRDFSTSGAWIDLTVLSADGKQLVSGSRRGALTVCDVVTGKVLRTLSIHSNLVESVAFSPDGKQLVCGSNDKTIKVWDVATGKLLRTLSGHTGPVYSVMFSPDGKRIASGSWDNTIKVWNLKSSRPQATLLPLPEANEDIQFRAKDLIIAGDKGTPPDAGEWFITTPEGYFDCSANAARYILWNVGGRLYPAESYYRRFRRPDLVQRSLRGEAVPPISFTNDDVPPAANFLSVQYEGAAQKADATKPSLVTVTVEARGRHDFRDDAIQLLVNNRPLPPEHEKPVQVSAAPIEGAAQALAGDTKAPIILGDKAIILGDKAAIVLGDKPIVLGDKPASPARGSATPYKFARRFTFRVPLPIGDEKVQLRAVAYDRQDLGSTPSTIWLRNQQARPVKGNLYALCVGLSRYQKGVDVKPGQRPAAGKIANLNYPDEDATSVAQRLRQEAQGHYGEVEVHTLLDEQVTLEKLRSELKWLQQKVRPGQIDTVVVFLSGHGLSNERGEFFFPTHGFDGSSTQSISSTSLSGVELQRELGSALRARTVFLFVDSCHSGALDSTRNSATGDDLSFSVKESGVYLLASSGALQTSLESNAWGHGVFTQALLDSLKDTRNARAGLIHFDVLTYLVPSQVGRLLREARLNENAMSPVVPLEGRYLDEPVVQVRP